MDAMRAALPLALWMLAVGCATPQPAGPEPIPDLAAENLGPELSRKLRPELEALAALPSDPGAAGRAGMLLQAYEQHELALPYLDRARLLQPGELRWHYLAGVSLGRLGRHAEAAERYRRCKAISRAFLPARRRLAAAVSQAGGAEAGLAAYLELEREHPRDPRTLVGSARARVSAGRSQQATELLLRALELEPAYAAAHYELAMVYRSAGQIKEAGRHLERYSRDPHAEPPDDDPLLRAVRALRSGAADHLQRAAEAEQAGRIEESIALHEKALQEDPALLQARVNLLILYGRQGRLDEAEQQYRLALEHGAESAELHYNHGVIAYRAGHLDEAKQAFTRALALNPNHVSANHNLAQILEQEGRPDEAMNHYQRAVANQPDHALSHYKIGLLWAQRRNAARAVRSFERAAREQSERTPAYQFHLAGALLASGERVRAVAVLRESRSGAVRLGQAALVNRIDAALTTLGEPAGSR